jgi:1-acyl-sn-glycerol-3-phosphate acyltransferase
MTLLRSLIYFACMSLTIVAFGLLITLFGRWMTSTKLDRLGGHWGRLNLRLQRVICGLDYRVEGLENLPLDGPCIVLAKHQSAWETIALRGILRDDQSWVLKQELLRIPLFGSALKSGKPIPIDRSAGRKAITKLVEQGREYLAEGRILIIFPEGTRTAPGERGRYGIGGALLAERSGIDVVPIAHNAGVFWRRRGVNKYPGEIQVRIGPVVKVNGKRASEINREVEAWIEEQQSTLPLERE